MHELARAAAGSRPTATRSIRPSPGALAGGWSPSGARRGADHDRARCARRTPGCCPPSRRHACSRRAMAARPGTRRLHPPRSARGRWRCRAPGDARRFHSRRRTAVAALRGCACAATVPDQCDMAMATASPRHAALRRGPGPGPTPWPRHAPWSATWTCGDDEFDALSWSTPRARGGGAAQHWRAQRAARALLLRHADRWRRRRHGPAPLGFEPNCDLHRPRRAASAACARRR